MCSEKGRNLLHLDQKNNIIILLPKHQGGKGNFLNIYHCRQGLNIVIYKIAPPSPPFFFFFTTNKYASLQITVWECNNSHPNDFKMHWAFFPKYIHIYLKHQIDSDPFLEKQSDIRRVEG